MLAAVGSIKRYTSAEMEGELCVNSAAFTSSDRPCVNSLLLRHSTRGSTEHRAHLGNKIALLNLGKDRANRKTRLASADVPHLPQEHLPNRFSLLILQISIKLGTSPS